MTKEREFTIRPGAIRTKSAQRQRSFIYQALAAAQKAGARIDRNGRIVKPNGSRFGRGRAAAIAANHKLTQRSRLVVVKARIVRHRNLKSPMTLHLRYLQREGVTKGTDKADLLGRDGNPVKAQDFTARCEADRHHFRFIVAPQDGAELGDIEGFTRDLMRQAEYDLGTGLDWAAVAHWNTEQPHVHILVRGVTDQGDDLVVARDYIKSGLRARAQAIITDELGPRTDQDIHNHISRQVELERFTDLDRRLLGEARRIGFVDLAHDSVIAPDVFHVEKMGRMRKLEALGLADQFAPSQWIISDNTEATLRELGERGDIIKRLHRSLSNAGLERGSSQWVMAGEAHNQPIIGRLMERGLDDELKGTAYAVIDGIDGQTHHVRLPSLENAGDSGPGSIVELHRTKTIRGEIRASLRVCSDLALTDQIGATGATWIDRLAVMGGTKDLAHTGFGQDVRQAIEARGNYLGAEGLTERDGERYRYARDLLKTLKAREWVTAVKTITQDTKLSYIETPMGTPVNGVLKRRLDLASGRFAVLEDSMGFRLVPWSNSLDTKIGQPLSGFSRDNGRIDWSVGLRRGLDIG